MTVGFEGAGDSVESPASAYLAAPVSRAGRLRRRFRDWRRSRPFWGGLLILLGGIEVSLTVIAPLRVITHEGLQGLSGYAIPLVMVLCGLLLWFSPAQRLFYSCVAVLLSLGTWFTANLGGFGFGMLLGIIGSSLAFGWSPASRRRKAG